MSGVIDSSDIYSLIKPQLEGFIKHPSLQTNAASSAEVLDIDLIKSSLFSTLADSSKPVLSIPNTSAGALLADKNFLEKTIKCFSEMSAPFESFHLDKALKKFTDNYAKKQQYESDLNSKYDSAVKDFSKDVDILNQQYKKLSDHLLSLKHKQPFSLDSQVNDTKITALVSTSRENETIDPATRLLVKEIQFSIDKTESSSIKAANLFNEIFNNAIPVTAETVIKSENHQNHLTSMGLFIELMLSLMKDIQLSNLDNIHGQSQLTKLMSETRLAEFKAKAEEVAEKNAAAQRLNKFLSIFGAVFGTLLSICSVVAAIPTGGASIGAVAVFLVSVSLAVTMLVDTILTFTNDFSFMGWLFEKVYQGISIAIEHTIVDLIEVIAKKKGDDVDSEGFKDFKKYFTMALTICVIIVLLVVPMLLCGSAATPATKTSVAVVEEVGKEAVKNVTTNVAKTAVKEGVKNAATEAAKNITNDATKNAAKHVIEKVAANTVKVASKLDKLKKVASGGAVTFSIIDGLGLAGLSIAQGNYSKQSYDALAAMGLTKNDIDNLAKIRELQNKELENCSNILLEFNNTICSILQDRYEALKSGYHNVERLGSV